MTLEYTNNVLHIVSKKPSDVFGLQWIPTTEPFVRDNADWAVCPPIAPPRHFSELNHSVLRDAFSQLKEVPKFIVEIGVNRSENYELSSTSTLFKIKPKGCVYLGIDIEDKSYLEDSEENIFTIKTDSANHEEVYKFMNEHNIQTIDFMFVDGWHSTTQVVEEWKYWEKMSKNGIMVFHDTNFHTGPVAVLDAIDTTLFSVEYFGRGLSDWGIGVVKRL